MRRRGLAPGLHVPQLNSSKMFTAAFGRLVTPRLLNHSSAVAPGEIMARKEVAVMSELQNSSEKQEPQRWFVWFFLGYLVAKDPDGARALVDLLGSLVQVLPHLG